MKVRSTTGKRRGFGDCFSRRQPEAGMQHEGGSPFDTEFFMVQGLGFKCMAWRDFNGKWRTAFENQILPGQIRVVG